MKKDNGMTIMIGLLGEKPKMGEKMEGGLLESDASSCPMATQDIELNLKNREKAIKVAMYGPMNPQLPNTDYWKKIAIKWSVSPEEAKQSMCGNCGAFDQSAEIIACIEQGIGDEKEADKFIDKTDLGYCEIFDFKCAATRTCAAWVVEGEMDDSEDMMQDDMGEEDYA